MKKLLWISLMLLLVGCQGQGNQDKSTTTDDVYKPDEEAVVDQPVDPTTEVEEETPELVPLKRESVLKGGMAIIPTTPYSFDLNSEIKDGVIIYSGSSPGIEFRKTYQLHLTGLTSDTTKLNISITDQGGNPLWASDLEVKGSFDHTFLLTMTESSRRETKITVKGDASLFELKSLTIQRQLGKPIFADEFEEDGLPNPDNWAYDIGGNGWGNGELQYYTNADLDNARVEDGQLIITALEETINNNAYSSARLISQNNWTYGRFEIKATLPYGRGTWPAIWMLPSGNQYGNWPNSGEIDIMEHVGFDMDVVHASLHMADFNFRKGWHPTAVMSIPDVDATPHVYTLEWSPYQIDMYIDDYHYLTFKNNGSGPKQWPYDQNFFLLLNIAVGGGWGGQQGVDPVYPQQMVIDYVRVYEIADDIVDEVPPNQVSDIVTEINGAVVDLTWSPVEDNYLVDHYLVRVIELKTGNERDYNIKDTNTTLMDLEGDADYWLHIFAVDEAGLMSERSEVKLTTGPISYKKVNTLIPADETYLLKGINFDEGTFTYLNNIENEDVFGYAFDLTSSGSYVMEFELSGNIFEGLIQLKQTNPELQDEQLLIELVTPKTGGWDVYETLQTEPFNLRSGKQIITIDVVKNGFRVKSAKLIKVD